MPLCSLCILSSSGSQILLHCCWQSVCLSRPLISVVVWRELHAPCAPCVRCAKFRYMCFHGHCFFPASKLKGGLGGVGSGSGPRVVSPRVGLEVPTAPPAQGCLYSHSLGRRPGGGGGGTILMLPRAGGHSRALVPPQGGYHAGV